MKKKTNNQQKMEMKLVQAHWAEQKLDELKKCCWKRVSKRFYSKWTTSSLLVILSQLRWPQPCSMCVWWFFFLFTFCEFRRQKIESYGVYFTYMVKIAYALWLKPNMLSARLCLCLQLANQIQMPNAYHSLFAARTYQIWLGIIVVNCN